MSNPLGMNEIKEAAQRGTRETGTTKAFENTGKNEMQRRDLHTINENLEGKTYPGTNVEYVRRRFTVNGERVEGVFPKFDSKFETSLPRAMLSASDDIQFRYCSKALAKQIETNPDMGSRYTPRQLDQIRNGEPRISGLTWHHKESTPGRMQLVNAEVHGICRHTGGRAIWGGGSDCR